LICGLHDILRKEFFGHRLLRADYSQLCCGFQRVAVDFTIFELNEDRFALPLQPVERYDLTLATDAMHHLGAFREVRCNGLCIPLLRCLLSTRRRRQLGLNATAERLPVLQLKLVE
jgi:hypothetical protein